MLKIAIFSSSWNYSKTITIMRNRNINSLILGKTYSHKQYTKEALTNAVTIKTMR